MFYASDDDQEGNEKAHGERRGPTHSDFGKKCVGETLEGSTEGSRQSSSSIKRSDGRDDGRLAKKALRVKAVTPRKLRAIQAVASLVRHEAELKFDCRRLYGKCHIVSHAFHAMLNDIGIASVMMAGCFHHPAWKEPLRFGDLEQKRLLSQIGPPEECYHVWVAIDGKAWDLTLTQFIAEADPVSVIKLPDERYSIREHEVSWDASIHYLDMKGLLPKAKQLYQRCRSTLMKEAA